MLETSNMYGNYLLHGTLTVHNLMKKKMKIYLQGAYYG